MAYADRCGLETKEAVVLNSRFGLLFALVAFSGNVDTLQSLNCATGIGCFTRLISPTVDRCCGAVACLPSSRCDLWQQGIKSTSAIFEY